MNPVKLTKTRIDKAAYEGEKKNGKWPRFVLWDTDLVGFGLRISSPQGKKSFILHYRANGRKRQKTIGTYGVLTLQQAKKEARRLLGLVSTGQDPVAEDQAKRKAETVQQLANRYMTEHAEAKKKSASIRNDRQMIRDYIVPKLGRLKVAAITRADVSGLHYSLREKPTTANRVLSLLSKMFNLAEVWGLRPDGSNPCRHVERNKEQQKHRHLSPDELGRLGDALREEDRGGVQAVAAIRLLLFTGCRRSEILNLRWKDVDLENGLLRLSDSKTGAKVVYLSTSAKTILASLTPTQGFEFVIEGLHPDKPRADLNKPWKRIRKAAGLEDVRLHDLRHTVGGMGAGMGISLHKIGGLLGHSQPSTTARYAHLAATPMHEAADRISAELEAQLKRAPLAEVVPLEKRRG